MTNASLHANNIISAYGVESPRLIYGTAWKKLNTARLVTQAITLGFRGIDTACQPKHYHEPGVGAGIAVAAAAGVRRQDLYIQTKFTSLSGQDPLQIPYDEDAPIAEQVAQSFAASLRNLQTDYLDCLVLHSPLPSDQQTMQAWRAMEAIYDAGGVRQLGISNCYRVEQIDLLFQKTRVKPAVVQNRCYAKNHFDRTIRQYCREHRILYQSFWTLTGNPDLLASKVVQVLAKRYQRSAAQILFRYLTQSGVIPLTGTCDEHHMREDLAIFDFQLSRDETVRLQTLIG